jgi:DNA-binding HxlR family transcriptional regulator
VLSLFANPLNTKVLQAHQEGPQRLGQLKEKMNWAAEATIRGAIGNLRDAGALEKRSTDHASNSVATVLTPAGKEMLTVPEALEVWLAQCPKGPIPIDNPHVKVAVKALAEGWSSTLMRSLATSPLTLTELSGLIPEVSYPSLERRIGWMRASGQIVALPKEARGTPYAPTDWLRRSVAPLSVAGRCERRHMSDAPPITDVDVEAAFLLTLPLVRFPQATSGSCLLASRTDPAGGEEEGPALAGVAIAVTQGKLASSTVDLDAEPTTWAIGTAEVWLDAVIDGRFEGLRIGGVNPLLATFVAKGLHLALFTDR